MPLTPWIVAHKAAHALDSISFSPWHDEKMDIDEIILDLISQYLIQGKITFKYDSLTDLHKTKLKEIEIAMNKCLTDWLGKLNGHILVAT